MAAVAEGTAKVAVRSSHHTVVPGYSGRMGSAREKVEGRAWARHGVGLSVVEWKRTAKNSRQISPPMARNPPYNLRGAGKFVSRFCERNCDGRLPRTRKSQHAVLACWQMDNRRSDLNNVRSPSRPLGKLFNCDTLADFQH